MDVNLNITGVNITNVSYIFWSNNTNDVNLYRPAANVLGTDDIFRLATTGTSGALQFVDTNARLYRSTNDLVIESSGQLRIPQDTNITGALYIANDTTASQSNGTLYLGKNVTGGWQWLRFDTQAKDEGGPGNFVFSAPVQIPSSSPAITFFDPTDPTNTTKMQSISYDPSNQQFSFTGGKIAQDFKNIVRNGGFESFSGSGVGTFTTESVSATPDGWVLNSGTAHQFAPASYSSGSEIFQGYNSLMVNTTGNISHEVKAFKLQPGRGYSIGVWVKTNGTATARLDVRGGAVQGTFTQQSASSPSGWVLLKGNFNTRSTLASGDSIRIELTVIGSGLGFFDAVQLNLGTVLGEYQDTPIVEVGEQIIYGGLRLQRTGFDRGGTLSVDKSIRTRQIEFSFGGDPGWGSLATDQFHDPRYNWGGSYSRQNVYLELTKANEVRFRSPSAGTSELFIDVQNPQPIIGTHNPNVGINITSPVNFTSAVNLGSTLLIKGDTNFLGWQNLTDYPAACSSGQFVTTLGDTITCTTPTPVEGGGWTDDGTTVRLTTATDSVGIGTATVASGTKLNISGGNVTVDEGTFFVDATNNRVGIGTTNPIYRLHVVHPAGESLQLGFLILGGSSSNPVLSSGASAGTITIGGDGAAGGGKIVAYGSLNDTPSIITFDTLNTERVRITSAGNVGIGTASPGAPLEVAKNADFIIALRGTGALTDEKVWGVRNLNDGRFAIGVYNDGLTTNNNLILADRTGMSVDFLSFWTGANVERMRIDSAGNVGINTTTPQALLQVATVSSSSTDAVNITNLGTGDSFVVEDSAGDTTPFLIDNAGNVGIGTAGPGAKLELGSGQIFVPLGSAALPSYSFTGDSDTGLTRTATANMVGLVGGGTIVAGFLNDQIVVGNGIYLGFSSGTPGGVGADVAIARNAADILEINSGVIGQIRDLRVRAINPTGGNVGIGTTTPLTKLEIVANDTNIGALTEVLTIDHFISNATNGTANIAGGILFRSEDTLGNMENVSLIAANLTTATNGSEASSLNFYIASGDNSGVSLIQSMRLVNGGIISSNWVNASNINVSNSLYGPNFVAASGWGNFSNLNVTNNAYIGGNVGIGTTGPGSKLEIKGDSTTGWLKFSTSGGNPGIVSTNDLGFKTASTKDTLYLSGTAGGIAVGSTYAAGGVTPPTDGAIIQGNVGIGTTSPLSKLDVNANLNNGDVGITVRNEAGGGWPLSEASINFIHFNSSFNAGKISAGRDGSGTYAGTAASADSTLRFYTSLDSTNTERMRITSAGNVGIGTTSPDLVLNGVAVGSGGKVVSLDDSTLSSIVLDGGTQTQILFNDQNEAVDAKVFQMSTLSGSLRFRSFTDAGAVQSTILTLLPGGNVGIGTTAPTHTLNVVGTTNITSNLTVDTADSTFHVDATNNRVGIGTTSPSARLHVGTAVDSQIFLGAMTSDPGWARTAFQIGDGNAGSLFMEAAAGDNNFVVAENVYQNGTQRYLGADVAFAISFLDGGGNTLRIKTAPSGTAGTAITWTNAMTFTSTGLVGINTTTPQALLQAATVSSSSTDAVNITNLGTGDSFVVEDSAGDTTPFIIDNAGNVGIGTTGPGAKLHVDDTTTAAVKITSDSSIDAYIHAGGDQNEAPRNATFGLDYSADGFAVNAGGTDLSSADFFVKSDGNVGIGTTIPGSALHLNASSNNYVQIEGQTASPARNAAVRLLNGATSQADFVMAASANQFITGSAAGEALITYRTKLHLANLANDALRMTIDSTGNVGIGTTSPVKKLDVVGDINATGTVFSGGSALVASGWTDDGTTVRLSTSTDNVGIGTASPGAPLEVAKNADFIIALRGTGALTDEKVWGVRNLNDGRFAIGAYNDGLTTNNNLILADRTGMSVDFLSFWTGANVERMRIDSAGNVGIGTASPSSLLHISGSNNNAMLNISNGTNPVLFVNGTLERVGIGTTSPTKKLHIVGGGIRINTSSTRSIELDEGGNLWSGISGDQGLLYTAGTKFYIGRAGQTSPDISFDSSGNVGIGTASPTLGKLDVRGGSTGDAVSIQAGNTGNELITGRNTAGAGIFSVSSLAGGSRLRLATDAGAINVNLDSNGASYFLVNNVGIGTTSPASVLDVRGAAGRGGITLSSSAAATVAFLRSVNPGTDDSIEFGTQVGGHIKVFTNNVERMRIENGGNVGINTTTPQALLQAATVSSSSTDAVNITNLGTGDSFVVEDSAGDTTPFVIDNAGNVGIGTAGPSTTLDVVGTVRFGSSTQGIQFPQPRTTFAGGDFPLIYQSLSGGSGLAFSNNGNLIIQPRTSDSVGRIVFATGTPAAERMTIESGGTVNIGYGTCCSLTGALVINNDVGNVGIGDSSPEALLEIANDSAAVTNGWFMVSSTAVGDGNVFIIDKNRNVGIGTRTPSALLTVSQNAQVNSGLFTLNRTDGLDATQWTFVIDDVTTGMNFGSLALRGGSGDDFAIMNSANTAPMFIVKENGNVGIGTATPLTRTSSVGKGLQIEDASRAVVGLWNAGSGSSPNTIISENGNGWWHVNFNSIGGSGNEIGFYSSTKAGGAGYTVTLQGTGNVGIGTTSPNARLHVSGGEFLWNNTAVTAGTSPAFGAYSTGFSDAGGTFRFEDKRDPQASPSFVFNVSDASGTVDAYSFYTGTNPALIIEQGGNVGIWATAPTSRLTLGVPDAGSTTLDWSNSAGSVTYARINGTSEQLSDNRGRLAFYTSSTTTLTERMRIDNAGNVGIGTTDPTALLSLSSTGPTIQFNETDVGTDQKTWTIDTLGGVFGIRSWNDGKTQDRAAFAITKEAATNQINRIAFFTGNEVEAMRIDNASRVGIGTTSPSRILEVTAANPEILINATATGTNKGAGLRFAQNTGVKWVVGPDASSGTGSANFEFHDFQGTAGARMVIQNNTGNVGIGTTGPAHLLHTVGSLATAGAGVFHNSNTGTGAIGVIARSDGGPIFIAQQGPSGGEVFRIQQNGNVGIGTTGPGTDLHVHSAAGSDTGFRLSDADVAHGMTTALGATDTFLQILSNTADSGTAVIEGASDAAGSSGMQITGTIGNADPTDTVPALVFAAAKASGASRQDLGALETAFQFVDSGNTDKFLTILGSGNVGIGTTGPARPLHVIANTTDRTIRLEGGTSVGSGIEFFTGQTAASHKNWAITSSAGIAGALEFVSTTGVGGNPTTGRLMISGNGSVAIGETDVLLSANLPNGSVVIGNGAFCVDNGGINCDDASRTAGNIYAVSTTITAIDIAENFPTLDETLEAGDLVFTDSQEGDKCVERGDGPDGSVICTKTNRDVLPFVAKAATGGSRLLAGVVSTKPGVLLGGFGSFESLNYKQVPVALAGRVPVKVNLENGPIAVGDLITSSSTAGVGMKAAKAGRVVGIALESYDGTEDSKILIFVNPHESMTPKVNELAEENSRLKAKLDSLESRITALEGRISLK